MKRATEPGGAAVQHSEEMQCHGTVNLETVKMASILRYTLYHNEKTENKT